MYAKLAVLSTVFLLAAAEARAQDVAGQVRLNKCLVTLRDGREVEVPALVPGQLVSLEVREGHEVEAGTVVGRIDDKQAKANEEERKYDVEVAREQAENDVNVQFAVASLRVAEKEYERSAEANKKTPNSVTQTEMMRLALNVEKTRLQIKVAEMEMRVAGFTMGSKKARLKEIEGVLDRSEIKAPVSGVVVELVKQRGEWCEPGAVVLKMVKMDLLRVEGFLNAGKHDPTQVLNRPVTVQVKLAGNVVERFNGKIAYVDPRVQAGGEYRVYAEVPNRKTRDQSHWLLRPGSEADMVIDLRAGLAQDGQPAPIQNASPVQTARR